MEGGYPEYTYATFTCKYGYALDGPFRSDCQRSGAWDKQSPTCNKGIILAKLSVKALGYPSEMIWSLHYITTMFSVVVVRYPCET